MRIRWLGDITGLNLHPTWEVKGIRVHTHKIEIDGKLVDKMLLVVLTTAEQYHAIVRDYGAKNIKSAILGIEVIHLDPNAVLWTWAPPDGYESLKTGTYTAFEILDDEG